MESPYNFYSLRCKNFIQNLYMILYVNLQINVMKWSNTYDTCAFIKYVFIVIKFN